MSAGEAVGMALSAALIGSVCGALLYACGHAAVRRAAPEERRIDAAISWLQAHGRRCRAAVAFVKAFRSLASEPRDSAVFAEQRELARKARRRWRRSERMYAYAKTAMDGWSRDPGGADAATRAIPDGEEIQRVALRGTQEEAESLFRRIAEAEKRALEWVRAEQLGAAPGPQFWRSLAAWAEGMISRVVRSWDRPGQSGRWGWERWR